MYLRGYSLILNSKIPYISQQKKKKKQLQDEISSKLLCLSSNYTTSFLFL